MSQERRDDFPAELSAVAERLRAGRAVASETELDELRRRVARRTDRARPGMPIRTEGVGMRSRVALVAVLVFGIMLTGTGATLAVSGLSSSDSAGTAQYVGPGGGGGGQDGAGDGADRGLGDPGDGAAGDGAPGLEGQGTAQIAARADDGLPLTGFAAIPLVIGGVAMLVAGLVLHRRTG